MRFFLIGIVSIQWLLFSVPVNATEHLDELETKTSASQSIDGDEQLVTYPASFFTRYQPATALEMVQQLPGFLLDDGESIRGFGESVGNVLINDEYPSAKQDSPSAILSRIPASQVERIELIRGQTRSIDMQGQAEVANIILYKDSASAIQYELFGSYSDSAPFRPGLNASLSHNFKNIDYNVGIDVERGASGEVGPDLVYDGDGNLVERRDESLIEKGLQLRGIYLNTTSLVWDSIVHLNLKAGLVRGPELYTSIRTPSEPSIPVEDIRIKYSEYHPSYEIGMDVEHSLFEGLTGKAIFLFTHSDSQFITRQINTVLPDTQNLFRRSDSTTIEKEAIARVEFDWSGHPDHNLQMNLEGAINTLDGSLLQVRDTGTGPVEVNVPGANSKVEEVRGDFLIKDSWALGRFELDFGMGAEVSTITQTGDVDQDRNFFFLKPQLVMTYSRTDTHQARLLVIREVSQLDFNDFVSASVFEDDDLALGNPDLRPERTWLSELSNEWRPDQDSVYTLAFYYHRINDVEDLLPLTPDFEVPGNIGDGARWGVKFESTTPLGWLGLDNAKLDIKLRWQGSSVTDPVTGEKRQLTANGFFSGPTNIRFNSENQYIYDVAYRQDFEDARIAWGWDIAEQAERPRYKVNELEVFNEGFEANVFVETTRWFGMKIRLDGRNLFNYDESRNRTLYVGERELTPVASRIIRDRIAGWRAVLTLSGSF